MRTILKTKLVSDGLPCLL